MTARATKLQTRRVSPVVRGRDISELAVLVRVGEVVVALPASQVARIVLAEDVAAAPAVGSQARVQIGERVYAAWSLSTLLGLAEPPTAWIVLRTSAQPGSVEIALAIGPCLAIAAHAAPIALPVGVIAASRAAVRGVFATDEALRARGAGVLGVRIDPLALIGAVALASAHGGNAS